MCRQRLSITVRIGSQWTVPQKSSTPAAKTFKQVVDANETLRAGNYGKTLTFTLSTTTP